MPRRFPAQNPSVTSAGSDPLSLSDALFQVLTPEVDSRPPIRPFPGRDGRADPEATSSPWPWGRTDITPLLTPSPSTRPLESARPLLSLVIHFALTALEISAPRTGTGDMHPLGDTLCVCSGQNASHCLCLWCVYIPEAPLENALRGQGTSFSLFHTCECTGQGMEQSPRERMRKTERESNSEKERVK